MGNVYPLCMVFLTANARFAIGNGHFVWYFHAIDGGASRASSVIARGKRRQAVLTSPSQENAFG